MMAAKDPISGFTDGADRVARQPSPAPRQPAGEASNFGPNNNPIMRAAGSLLQLLGRLRAGLLRAKASRLSPHIAAAIAKFERDMSAARVSPAEASAAKLALRATADEVLANLPAADLDLAAQADAANFSRREESLRGFFVELGRVKADPKAHVRLLELYHACLALGFQGADQARSGGDASLQAIRRDLYAALRKASPPPPDDLSPRWRGLPLASRAARLRIPVWAAAGLAGLLLFGVFIGLRVSLGARAGAAAAALASLNPPTPVSIIRKSAVASPPPLLETPERAAQLDHIRLVLEPDIAAGTLSVDQTANEIVIRIPDRVLFRPGRTAIRDEARPLLTYIALAFEADDGAVKVIGRSDAGPMSPIRFATSFELALNRAEAVAALLRQSLSRPERVEARGEGPEAQSASGGRDPPAWITGPNSSFCAAIEP